MARKGNRLCWGRHRSGRRCRKRVSRGLFCHHHREQLRKLPRLGLRSGPLGILAVLSGLAMVIALLADIKTLFGGRSERASLDCSLPEVLEGFRTAHPAISDEMLLPICHAVQELLDRGGLFRSRAVDRAVRRVAVGDTDEAEAIWAGVYANKVAEGRAIDRQAAQAARHLGALAYDDPRRAIEHYRASVALDPASWEGWHRLGNLLRRTGSFVESEDALSKALALAEAAGDRRAQAETINGLGLLHRERGDFEDAVVLYHRALELNRALVDDGSLIEGSSRHQLVMKAMANSHGNLGLVERRQGKIEQATANIRTALAIELRLKHERGIARQYGNLGLLYRDRNDLEGAASLHRRALLITESIGDRPSMAVQLVNLAGIALEQDRIDEAEAGYRRAMAISEDLGDRRNVAGRLGNLAGVARARGELDEAEGLMREALAIDRALPDKEGEAIRLLGIASIHLRREQLAEAIEANRQALAIFEQLDHQQGVATALANMGLAQSRSGEVSEARTTLDRARETFTALGMSHRVEQVAAMLADLPAD